MAMCCAMLDLWFWVKWNTYNNEEMEHPTDTTALFKEGYHNYLNNYKP